MFNSKPRLGGLLAPPPKKKLYVFWGVRFFILIYQAITVLCLTCEVSPQYGGGLMAYFIHVFCG